MHAIGDAAIEQVITAYEAALADYPREDHRHIIIHGDLLGDDLLERVAKSNIHMAIQTPFLHWPEENLEYLKSIIGDRAYEKHPLKKMLDAGIVFANGSDYSSNIEGPIYGMYCCCNHPKPEYSIDPLNALKASTINAAKLSFDDDKMGSLTVGKVADFVVLDRDILNIPVETIKDTQIEQVYFGGELYK